MLTSGFQPKLWCKSTAVSGVTVPVTPLPSPAPVVPSVLPSSKSQLYIGDIRESSLLAVTQNRKSAIMPRGFQPGRPTLAYPPPAPVVAPLPPPPALTQQLPNNLPRPQPQPQPINKPPVVSQCSSLWAEKHRPQQLRHVLGNPKSVQRLVKWATDRKRNPSTSHDPHVVALLSGPPGIGKTTVATLVLRDLGFKIVEVNASDTRTRRAVYNLIKETVTRKPLNKPCAIILDELDGAVSQVGNSNQAEGGSPDMDDDGDDDNSGVAGVWQFVQECKKHIWPVAYPIICISNDVASKAMRQLMTAAETIKFFAPFNSVVQTALTSICNKEGIRLNAVQQKHVIEAARGDLRRLCQLLQMISIRPMVLNAQIADMLQTSKSDGPVDDLFPSVRHLMYQKDEQRDSLQKGQQLVDKDAAIITLMVHENLPALAQYGGDSSATLEQLADCYDDLSLVDMLDTVDWQARGCEDNVSGAVLSGMARTRLKPFRTAALKSKSDPKITWTRFFDQRKLQSAQASVVSAASYAWNVSAADLVWARLANNLDSEQVDPNEMGSEQSEYRRQVDPEIADVAQQYHWVTNTTPKSTPKKQACSRLPLKTSTVSF